MHLEIILNKCAILNFICHYLIGWYLGGKNSIFQVFYFLWMMASEHYWFFFSLLSSSAMVDFSYYFNVLEYHEIYTVIMSWVHYILFVFCFYFRFFCSPSHKKICLPWRSCCARIAREKNFFYKEQFSLK